MEAEGAALLCSRSRKHDFKYTTFVGDGDSSPCSAVCAMNDGRGPYEGKNITKDDMMGYD